MNQFILISFLYLALFLAFWLGTIFGQIALLAAQKGSWHPNKQPARQNSLPEDEKEWRKLLEIEE